MPEAPAAPAPVRRFASVSAWDVLAQLRRFGASWVKAPDRLAVVAKALSSLGLIEPAGEDELTVDALRARLLASPAIVPAEARRELVEANLNADRRGALPAEARALAERSIERELLLRTESGEVALTATGRSALWSWRWAGPSRAAIREQAEALAAGPGKLAPPAALVGLSPPWGALEFLAVSAERDSGQSLYQRRIHLIEPDLKAVGRAIASADLTPLLSASRVAWHLGVSAVDGFERELREQEDAVAPTAALAAPGCEPAPGIAARLGEAIERVASEKRERLERVTAEAAAVYEDATPVRWAERFAKLARGEAEGKILVSTSRHSTFIRHASADLVEAFRALGHRAELLVEPDEHSLNTPSASLSAVTRIEPDLVVTPNHFRTRLAKEFPERVPFVTWVQDAMAHLFDDGEMARVGEFDLFAGYAFTMLFEDFGVDPSAATVGPVPVSPRKFHDGPVDPALEREVACDVALISNHGVPPERLREQLLEPLNDRPAMRRLAEDACDAAAEVIERAPRESLAEAARSIAREILERGLGKAPTASEIHQLEQGIVLPMAGRLLRHRFAKETAEICTRRGWRFRIFGAWWETSELAELASPPLEHGEPLRAAYKTARATLHLDLRTLAHQRVLECGLSGGLPVAFFFRDALSRATHAAALERLDAGAEPIRRVPDGRAVFRSGGSATGERLAAIRRALGDETPDEIVQPEGCPPSVRLRDDELALYDATTLLPDLPNMVFRDAAELEGALERAIEDRAWREARSRELRERVLASHTSDAFAQRLLEHAARRFASLASD